MLKKITALTAVLVMLICFCGCGKTDNNAFSSGELTVSAGVYAYYLDKVSSSPESYGVKEGDREKIIAAAEKCCREYLGAIALCQKKKVTLSNSFKRTAAENTENLWKMFSGYYESIGVTKQDITQIYLHECRKQQLLEYYFGAQGISPVADMDLKEEFVDMYVGFKAITGSLTRENDKGETTMLSDAEIEAVKKQFQEMALKINSSLATIDELNVQYNEGLDIIVTGSLSTELMKEGDPMYDDEFFGKVLSITHGKAAVVISGSSIYVIERQTIATTDEDAFAQYRAEVLEKVKMPSVISKIEKTAKGMTFEENEKVTRDVQKLLP